MAKVLNTASHPVDLSDGRTLAPGEVADGINTDHPHQRSLVIDGHLFVQEGPKPRARKSETLVAIASGDKNEEE